MPLCWVVLNPLRFSKFVYPVTCAAMYVGTCLGTCGKLKYASKSVGTWDVRRRKSNERLFRLMRAEQIGVTIIQLRSIEGPALNPNYSIEECHFLPNRNETCYFRCVDMNEL